MDISRFNYFNADWDDLIEILDSKTEQDLKAWSNIWISSAGMPQISLERSDLNVTISQKDPFEKDRLWMQDLNLVTSFGLKNESFDEDQINLTLSESTDYVLPNGSGTEYGSFILDDASSTYLLDNVGNVSNGYERGVIWLDLYETLVHGKIEPQTYVSALLASLETETDKLLVELHLDQLNKVFWKFLNEKERQSLASEIETTLWAKLNTEAVDIKSAFFKAFVKISSTSNGSDKLFQIWNQTLF